MEVAGGLALANAQGFKQQDSTVEYQHKPGDPPVPVVDFGLFHGKAATTKEPAENTPAKMDVTDQLSFKAGDAAISRMDPHVSFHSLKDPGFSRGRRKRLVGFKREAHQTIRFRAFHSINEGIGQCLEEAQLPLLLLVCALALFLWRSRSPASFSSQRDVSERSRSEGGWSFTAMSRAQFPSRVSMISKVRIPSGDS